MLAIDDESLTTQRTALSVLRMLRPYAVKGHDKIRVGRIYDGGYVMVDDFAGIDAAYSLGISNEVSWDRQMAAMGIDIYQYDHTIDYAPEQNDKFHWFRIGIAGRSQPENNLETLENLVRRNGHEASELILKCDIEGWEYEMLSSTPVSILKRFKQVVLEVHDFDRLSDLNYGRKIHRAFANLSETHKLVHVHANNHAYFCLLGGIAVPQVLEVTFVRADSYVLSPSNETFPTELDPPCTPARVDYYLGTFTF